ncbi:MAG: hypothetical protein WCW16_01960 [Candidatus Magasanikbacteria bacterium]|jgi:hypothetical protein
MQHKQGDFGVQQADFSWVYLYLVAGIAIAVAVFLFVPKVSIG